MTNNGKHVLAAAALCGILLLILTACDTEEEHTDLSGSMSGGTTAGAPGPEIRLPHPDGSSGVGISAQSTQVSVLGGELTQVTMTDQSGTQTTGNFAPDRKSWKPDKALSQGTTYTISAGARQSAGAPARSATVSFTTADAQNSTVAACTPGNGATVGVGMPVSLTFDKPVLHRDTVRSRITVRASSGQQATGRWLSNRRLVFRPREFWQPHSEIVVDIDLDGIPTAPRTKGVQKETLRFAVSHAQISTVDTRTHRMTVMRDGTLLSNLPVSAGAPSHPTYNGTLIISEKHKTTHMSGATVGFLPGTGDGYDIPDVPHAMRLTDSGTFIHGNYWTPRTVFGTANTSHGCIGIEDSRDGHHSGTPAAWFYDHSQPGDIIVVTGSTAPTVAPDNGLNVWNMNWNTWSPSSTSHDPATSS
ncbi:MULTISPECIES: L,D-transpeptidase [Streptomyces]|uniref:L,D-transpeptidase n=1 Tax=Streptomyces TaxID=1883 RepID=UPI00345B80EB